MKIKLLMLAILSTVASKGAFSVSVPNTNIACSTTDITCSASESWSYILVDSNGYPDPNDQGLKVYAGLAGGNQIEILSADRMATIFTTQNGNQLSVTDSGTTIETAGGAKTQFLNDSVQFNNQLLTGIKDGSITDTSADAINGSQLFQMQLDVTDSITTQVAQAKADAISQSNAYTDVAKADAIAQSNTYTDQEIDNLSNRVVHYDSNEDGTPNKNSVTFEGVSGTKLTNIANGQVQSGSKDAVNGDQLNTTNQALVQYVGGGAAYDTTTQTFSAPTFTVGNVDYHNVADSVSALDNRIDFVSERVDGLTNRVGDLEDQLEQGLAMSAALTGLFQPYGVGKYNLTIAGGGYGSHGAIALGSGYRFNESIAMKAGIAAVPGKGKATYNLGLNFEW